MTSKSLPKISHELTIVQILPIIRKHIFFFFRMIRISRARWICHGCLQMYFIVSILCEITCLKRQLWRKPWKIILRVNFSKARFRFVLHYTHVYITFVCVHMRVCVRVCLSLYKGKQMINEWAESAENTAQFVA